MEGNLGGVLAGMQLVPPQSDLVCGGSALPGPSAALDRPDGEGRHPRGESESPWMHPVSSRSFLQAAVSRGAVLTDIFACGSSMSAPPSAACSASTCNRPCNLRSVNFFLRSIGFGGPHSRASDSGVCSSGSWDVQRAMTVARDMMLLVLLGSNVVSTTWGFVTQVASLPVSNTGCVPGARSDSPP